MHIGIIMDGNGRWAASKGLPRSFGHRKGAKNVSEIIKSCPDLGIKTLTLYAFSTENWNRAAHEVASLMRLFRGYLQTKYLDIINNNIKVTFLWDTNPLPSYILSQKKKTKTDLNDLKEIIDRVGGFTYALQKISEFNDQAINALSPYPDSPYKKSMVDLISFNAQRKG